ncbi:MAG: SRPBCC family protein [Bacteroidia bacterium]
MKILKNILIVLISIILLAIVVSFFLPGKVYVERSIEINTKVEIPFKFINNLKDWDKWSPWHNIDSLTQYTYSEFAEGEGSWYTWKSNNPDVGKGKLTILESKPNELIKTKLEFEGMGVSYADYIFKTTDKDVKVIWTLTRDGEGLPWYMIPMSKYFNLFMDKLVGADYEKGLKALKELSEKQPQLTIAGFEAEIKMIEGFNYISVRKQTPVNKLSITYGEIFNMLVDEFKKNNSKPIGFPFSINHSFNNNMADIEAGLPVAKILNVSEPVLSASMPPFKALVIQYKGDYNQMDVAYKAAFEYLAQQNLKQAGPTMEFYVSDPETEKNPANVLTELVIPIE